MRGFLTVLCLIFAVGAMPGCGNDDDREAGKRRAQNAKKKRAKQEQAAVAAKAKAEADAKANIYKYTPKPLFDLIPAQPVVGRLNGQPWPVAAVVFEPKGDHWTMNFYDKALARPTGLARGTFPLTLDLSGLPGEGVKLERALSTGGSTWKLPAPPRSAPKKSPKKGKKAEVVAAPPPAGPSTWRTRSAYVLEFTTWQAAPFDAKKPAFQVAGKASGRIAVVYEGRDGKQHAWVAGTFENALIRYMGQPTVAHMAPVEPAVADTKKSAKGSKRRRKK